MLKTEVVRPVFLAGVPDAYQFLEGAFDTDGTTYWIVSGFFSGRYTNLREWHFTQYAKPLDTSKYEINDFGEVGVEFCVISWCIIPDPNPASNHDPKFRAESAASYAETLRQMLQSGVRICSPNER